MLQQRSPPNRLQAVRPFHTSFPSYNPNASGEHAKELWRSLNTAPQVVIRLALADRACFLFGTHGFHPKGKSVLPRMKSWHECSKRSLGGLFCCYGRSSLWCLAVARLFRYCKSRCCSQWQGLEVVPSSRSAHLPCTPSLLFCAPFTLSFSSLSLIIVLFQHSSKRLARMPIKAQSQRVTTLPQPF
jgi:hypothetical protein